MSRSTQSEPCEVSALRRATIVSAMADAGRCVFPGLVMVGTKRVEQLILDFPCSGSAYTVTKLPGHGIERGRPLVLGEVVPKTRAM